MYLVIKQFRVSAETVEEAIKRHGTGIITSITAHKLPDSFPVGKRVNNDYHGRGPGTELRKLIAKFGFKPKAGCKCTQHIREMDLKGEQWCRDNVDTIVGWLREEAARSGYPFTEIGAKILIKRAISKSVSL